MACESVLVDDIKHCFICKAPNPQMHHCYFGAKRKIADKYKFIIPLCYLHHTGSKDSPHQNREIDLVYKRMAQRYYESELGTRSDFIKEFGKSYIDE